MDKSKNQIKYASFNQRLLAHNIDLIPILLLLYSTTIFPRTSFDVYVIAIIYTLYNVTFELSPMRATPGKKWTKLHIAGASEAALPSKIILRNLLDNAIKFSNAGGIIKIYTQFTKDGFLDLVVEDYGIGMNKKTLEKLRKETISVSEKENNGIIGSGLGLQLCKSMIKKNKGVLTIESELGKGTKMIVSLLKPLTNG